jgi:uncharacterized membrane protein
MENVVIMTVPSREAAEALLDDLDGCDEEGGLTLRAATHFSRAMDGRFTEITDVRKDVPTATAAGAAVGTVVGLFGGPLAILLGGATGALAGALFDATSMDDVEDLVEGVIRAVPKCAHAVIVVADESSPLVVNQIAGRHDASVLRRSRGDLEAELAAAEEALQAAREAAYRVLATRRRVAAEKNIIDRLGDIKNRVLDRA